MSQASAPAASIQPRIRDTIVATPLLAAVFIGRILYRYADNTEGKVRRSVLSRLEKMGQLILGDPQRFACKGDGGRSGNAVLDRFNVNLIAVDGQSVGAAATLGH